MKYLFLLLFLFSSFASSKLININFNDLSINELIKITSQKIGKNILVTDKIDGKVDFISSRPIDERALLDILNYCLKAKGYKLIDSGHILRVVKENYNETKTVSKKSSIKEKSFDKKIEILFLENIEAKNIETILNKILSQSNSKKSLDLEVTIDEELNAVIINSNEDRIKKIKSFIEKIDIAKEQVYIKAVIVELDNDLIEDIGLKFGILGGKSYSGGLYTFSSNLNGGDAIAIDTSSIGLSIPNVTSTLALGASLNLLNKTYGLDIISEPSILCVNNKESSIYVGETISIQTGTTVTDGGNTSTTYEREDIGLTLKVKPRVFKNRKVDLVITTLVEDIKNRNTLSSNPDTSKKEIKTEAILNNGESVIIGGLMEKKKEKTVEKVPFASDIPLIGELFKNRFTNAQNKNLVVIVTPYIIPKNRDLTYVREELAKLKSLEDEFLQKALIKLREKKTDIKKEDKKSDNLHENMMKKFLGN